MQRRLQTATQRLNRLIIHIVNAHQTRLNRASARLESLSPLAVISRGYALVYAADGTLLRSAADITVGQMVRARLARGALEAKVTQTTIEEVEVPETNNS
jgi:exodeoxyribonuclease VII large subunit